MRARGSPVVATTYKALSSTRPSGSKPAWANSL